MIKASALQLDLQLLTMHPVQLEPFARLMILGEKELALRPAPPLLRSHPALKRASLPTTNFPGSFAKSSSKTPRLSSGSRKHLFDFSSRARLAQRRLDPSASNFHRLGLVLQAALL